MAWREARVVFQDIDGCLNTPSGPLPDGAGQSPTSEQARMLQEIGRAIDASSVSEVVLNTGRGLSAMDFIVDGQDTGSDEGIRRVVESAGLDFERAKAILDSGDWRREVEANRQTMYEELGVWGVPSYRLRGPVGEPDLCVWGQDRLWLVAAEIRRRLALPA